MKLLKIIALGVIAATLTACSARDVVSRNAPLQAPRVGVQATPQVMRDYSLHSIRFVVPEDMTVSEANSYYPVADIVWRGDPMGDRSAQISDIFQTSIRAAGLGLTGSTPVTVDVELHRFHSVTERTRNRIGGVHNIEFDLTVRHALTGAILEQTRFLDASLPALGGFSAMAAHNDGQTQKVRIITQLSSRFFDELTGLTGTTRPNGRLDS